MPNPYARTRLIVIAAAVVAVVVGTVPSALASSTSTAPYDLRIAAGSGHSELSGKVVWGADQLFHGGEAVPVRFAPTGDLGATARQGAFSYDVVVPTAGSYDISLVVGTTMKAGAGLNVVVNGKAVVTNDAAVRTPERIKTVTVTIPVVVAASNRTLVITPTERATNAALIGLEVRAATHAVVPLPSTTASSATHWLSGVWPGGALDAANVEAFGTFRGASVGIATIYQVRDSWSTIATNTWAEDQYAGWKGTLSIGLPLIPDSGVGSLADVAAGKYDADFSSFAHNLVAEGRGASIVRLAWEFNIPGWASSATNATTWKAAFIHVVGVLRAADPAVKIDWNGNYGSDQTGFSSFNQLYPGDAYVDIVGVDAYNNQYNPVTNAATWNAFVTAPGGLDAWRNFAALHHKPWSVPEWGLFNSGGGDNAFFIQMMHSYFAKYASTLSFEAYFNEPQSYIESSLSGPDQNPKAAAEYALLWRQES